MSKLYYVIINEINTNKYGRNGDLKPISSAE